MTKQTYNPLPKEEYMAIKPGDVVERMLAFCIPNYLIVGEVDDEFIYIGKKDQGGWKFKRETGLEVDDDIPTPPEISYIRRVLTEEERNYLKAGFKELPYPYKKYVE